MNSAMVSVVNLLQEELHTHAWRDMSQFIMPHAYESVFDVFYATWDVLQEVLNNADSEVKCTLQKNT